MNSEHQTGNVSEPSNNSNNLALHTVLPYTRFYLNAATTLSEHIIHLLQVRSQVPAAKNSSSAPGSNRQVGERGLNPGSQICSHHIPLPPHTCPLQHLHLFLHLSLSSSDYEFLWCT
ncbi:unnamed protein product [Rangifer tarandus platyrhynchus]|uniref:Uncharacterized protein n=1 Tax=Rangifer tarandus platyrhynchus TaxID=3082113 RepID=A0ABN8Z3K5_RANTA|nr:unnamed protein product [Rangifer tarandus platyrhynchus]